MSDDAEALFDPAPFVPQQQAVPTPESPDDADARRLRTVDRRQLVISTRCLNDLLPPQHEARLIWQDVCTLNLRPLLQRIQAVPGGRGRNATDPRILIALWLSATVEGLGSARPLAR